MYSFIDYKGVNAQVFAVNQFSAEAQLDWVLKMYDCFCPDCCSLYKSNYYVEITNPSYGPCREQGIESNTRLI